MSEKQNAASGKVKVFLERSVISAVVHALGCFLQEDTANTYCKYAADLRETIEKYAVVRKGKGGEEDTVSLFLYPDEAAVLIKVLSVYVLARDGEQQDFLTALQTKKS